VQVCVGDREPNDQQSAEAVSALGLLARQFGEYSTHELADEP